MIRLPRALFALIVTLSLASASAILFASPTHTSAITEVEVQTAPGAPRDTGVRAGTAPRAPDAPTGSLYWDDLPALPEPRFGHGVSIVGDKLYVLGGARGADNYSAAIWEYDLTSKSYITKTEIPTLRWGFGTATGGDGKIYLVGGTFTGGLAKNSMDMYDAVTNAWAAKAPMQTPRISLGAAMAPNGRMYAIGGHATAGSPTLSSVEEYNPDSNTWSYKASMHTPRTALAAVAASDGKIYTLGGISDANQPSTSTLATIEAYDPATDTWDLKASMLTARRYLGAVAFGGKIYAIGGYDDQDRLLNSVEEYDLSTNRWTASTSMPTPATWFAATPTEHGSFYVVGGWNGSAALANMRAVSPQPVPLRGVTISGPSIGSTAFPYTFTASISPITSTLPVTYTWQATGDVPATHTAALSDSVTLNWDSPGTKVITVTASNALATVVATHSITLTRLTGELTWRNLASLPMARASHGAAMSQGKVFVFGGDAAGLPYYPSVLRYDPAVDAWDTLTSLPTLRSQLGVVADETGRVYVIGGVEYPTWRDTVEVFDPIAGSWATRARMPTARHELAVAMVGGRIYAIGGYNPATGELNTVEMYDPTMNLWSTKAGMYWARSGLAVTVGNGKIYAIGGSNQNGLVAPVEEYDPDADVWTVKSSMPTPRKYLGVAAIDGRVFAIGGCAALNCGGTSTTSTIETFNPATDAWESWPGLPDRLSGFGIATTGNGTIYVVGGFNGTGGVASVREATLATLDPSNASIEGVSQGWPSVTYTFTATVSPAGAIPPITYTWQATEQETVTNVGAVTDVVTFNWSTSGPKTITVTASNGTGTVTGTHEVDVFRPDGDLLWTTRTSLPQPLHNAGAAAVVDGKVYVVGGGRYGYGMLASVWAYDPVLDTWANKTSLPYEVEAAGVVAPGDGKIYVIGGIQPSFAVITTVLAYDPRANTWETKASLPKGNRGMAVAAVSGKIYVMGGFNYGEGQYADVYEYDPNSNVWVTRSSMPTARDYGAAAQVDGKIYVIGGYGGGELATVERYDPVANTWQTMSSMPAPRSALAAIALANGRIYAFGGQDTAGQHTTVFEYDPARDVWTVMRPMPTARSFLMGATVDGRSFYAVGGQMWPDITLSVVEQATLMPVPISSLAIAGPTDGTTGTAYPFTATVAPFSATIPITYTWRADEQVPVTHTGSLTDAVAFNWSTPGTKVITATAANDGGAVTATRLITIYTPSVADFTATPLSGTVPLTVAFSNSSTGDFDAILWDFGDGITSTISSPIHSYSRRGSYTVTLTISGTGGRAVLTRQGYITAHEPAHAAFTATPTSGIAPLTVTFANQSSGDYSASLWDFGDGVTSGLESPTHTYTTIGTYAVSLTVSGPGGTDTVRRANYISATGMVDIVLIPPRQTVAVGEVFTVPIEVRAGTQQVDGLAAYIQFDPTVFQVVDLAGSPAEQIENPGSPLNVELQNAVDNTLGSIDFAAGRLSGVKPSGTFTAASIHFRALVKAEAGSPVTFADDAENNRRTNVTLSGHSVLRSATGGLYSVIGNTDLLLLPANATIGIDQVFTVSLQVQSGAQEIDAVNAYLDFDPQVFQVVDPDGNPTGQIENPGSPMNLQSMNWVDNTTGRIDYAVGRLAGPWPSGTFTIGIVRLKPIAQAPAGSSVGFAFDEPGNRSTDATRGTNSVLRGAQEASYTIVNATIHGAVGLDGREITPPGGPFSVPLHIELYTSGVANPIYSSTVHTNNWGQFTLDRLIPGTYAIRVKNLHTLANVRENATIGAGTNEVAFCTLVEGDADDNNQVNILDFSVLASAFGTSAGQARWDARADFNESRQINIIDFSLLAGSYGRYGDQACQ